MMTTNKDIGNQWIHADVAKPKSSGRYWVQVEYDDEMIDGHLLYEGGKYETYMDVTVEEECFISGNGPHDEQWEDVIYWCDCLPKSP